MAKILLVEDDNNLREIYQARLQAEGYTIVAARDGEEALVVAKAEKPELIIADVMMPKISGFEMLDIVRNTDTLKGVKVIMLTALGQSEDQKRADKLGADRYLVKSQVTLEDIVKAAKELLGAADTPAPVGTDTASKPQGEPTAEAQTEAPATKPISVEVKTEPASTDKAETAKEEAADAEAKIEDFVAGATSEPTAPAAEPAPAETPKADDSAKTADDKLMADAVDTLKASADAEAGPQPDAKPDEAGSEPAAGGKKPNVGGQRIIQPIDSEPKKDLGTLLAEEEAKSTDGAAPDEAPKTPTDKPDPNNIAL